jgi:hypothetical protein
LAEARHAVPVRGGLKVRAGAEEESVVSQDRSRFTLYLVGHAHIGLGYRWWWGETVHRIARDTFRGVLRT